MIVINYDYDIWIINEGIGDSKLREIVDSALNREGKGVFALNLCTNYGVKVSLGHKNFVPLLFTFYKSFSVTSLYLGPDTVTKCM